MRTLVVLAAALLAGCSARFSVPAPQDTLRDWSAHPLPPDGALAAAALAPGGPCRMHASDELEPKIPPVILVQDRRTPDIATFLVQDATHFGSCTVTRSSGNGGAGWGPIPGVATNQLTIDDQGGGTLADGNVQELGGRVRLADVQVVVQAFDGREVVASVANGYWLAWWPDTFTARRVVARDVNGTELASVEPST